MSTLESSRSSLVARALPIYLGLLFAILTVVGLVLVVRLRHVLLLLFLSVLFAAALGGPSEWLHDRLRLPRALAALLLYAAATVVLAVVGWLVVPPLLGQVAEFADRAPEYAERYEGVERAYTELREDYPALPPFDTQLSRLGDRILEGAGERALALPGALFGLLLDALAVFVISLLLVTNRWRMRRFLLSLVAADHRRRVGYLVDRIWVRLGVYLRAKVIVMAIIGAATYVSLLLIDVPFAVPLAIVVAFGELIPRVGPWLARVPLLSIAALEGWKPLVLTFVASIVIQNAKGFFVSPFVEGDQLEIHPLLVFVAVLAGATLGGLAGAFVAVPVAAVVDILVLEVAVPWRRNQLARRESTGLSPP